MLNLSQAAYLLRETAIGIRRGGWMNWAAVSTMTVLLFLFGISLQTTWQIEGLLNHFGSQLVISVYLDSGIDATSLVEPIQALPTVTQVTPVSKEVAWQRLTEELGMTDVAGAAQQLNGNPLTDELRVKARTADAVPQLAQQLEGIPSVSEVRYVTEAIQRLSELHQGLRWLSLGIVSVLSLTAAAVITTTIRLIVMARRQEIEVMQLVGATSLWIYLPFLLQGAAFGLAGAAVAWGLLLSIQQFLHHLAAQPPDLVQFLADSLQLSLGQILLLPLSLFALGSAVGLGGSLIAVRKLALR
ncbi:ABC transporter permease [Romeria aff. gracilis LEGE 07310]|uniref:Cell division protein FtsX n=1 Tax=Vasconcelosia minhoensis LEGE 07310 TaxID=915328 RepID=A0A8J7AC82_9CYAN|nr:ABC transporter permease [Romeria aff. gracilis LEGE 07310]